MVNRAEYSGTWGIDLSKAHETIDFYPDQASQIHTRRQTRTFRLGDRSLSYDVGETILLTELGIPLVKVKITKLDVKRFSELGAKDLKGTSFRTLDKAKETLTLIYPRANLADPLMTVIDWRYAEES
jgi:hypothetical protein